MIAVIRYIIELLPLQILIAGDVILFIGLRKVDTSLKLLRGKNYDNY